MAMLAIVLWAAVFGRALWAINSYGIRWPLCWWWWFRPLLAYKCLLLKTRPLVLSVILMGRFVSRRSNVSLLRIAQVLRIYLLFFTALLHALEKCH